MKPGDPVRFREPGLARGHDVPEDAVGRIVEIMALAGEEERAVVAFTGGPVLTGIAVADLAPAEMASPTPKGT